MNKNSLLAIAMFSIVVAFSVTVSGCSKEGNQSSNTNATIGIIAKALPSEDTTIYPATCCPRKYFDNGKIPGVEGIDYGCEKGQGDCLNTIYVTAHVAKSLIQSVITPIRQNPSNTGMVVSENYTLLLDLIAQAALDDVVNGNSTFTIRGVAEPGNTIYFVFAKEGTVVYVQPITL